MNLKKITPGPHTVCTPNHIWPIIGPPFETPTPSMRRRTVSKAAHHQQGRRSPETVDPTRRRGLPLFGGIGRRGQVQ